MPRPPKTILASSLAALAAVAAGCGEEIAVPESQTALRQGAELFTDRCSGCHTLDAAAARGSKPEGQVKGGERTNGPNFNTRHVEFDDVLFAIRNGGFSGAIMPANIVVGDDAEKVARFLDRYSGGQLPDEPEQQLGPGAAPEQQGTDAEPGQTP